MTLQTIVLAFAIFVIAQTHEVLLFGSCVRRLSCVRLRRRMQNILTSGIVLALAQALHATSQYADPHRSNTNRHRTLRVILRFSGPHLKESFP